MPLMLTVLVLVGVAFYTLFTGATASVVRAAIMSAVLLMAPVVGRRYDPVAALAMSAALMTAFDPNQVFDPGFDLSFGALLGIGSLSPAISGAFMRLHIPGWLSAALATGLGAQAFTLPLIALLTGRVSLVSLVATLFVDPALLPLMVFGILATILFYVPFVSALAVVLGWLSWLAAGWMVWSVQLWSSLPAASIDLGNVDPRWVWACYFVVGGLTALRNPTVRKYLPLLKTREGAAIAGTATLWAAVIWIFFVR